MDAPFGRNPFEMVCGDVHEPDAFGREIARTSRAWTFGGAATVQLNTAAPELLSANPYTVP